MNLYKGKGDKNSPSNNRGIVLLNILGKLFEGILNERLKKWVAREDILVPEQAGFRKGLGTVDNVFVVRSLVERIIKQRGRKVYLCFIDFERAFDTIDRSLLWLKLHQLGISGKILRVLQRFYRNVELIVLMRNRAISRGFKTSRDGTGMTPWCVEVLAEECKG